MSNADQTRTAGCAGSGGCWLRGDSPPVEVELDKGFTPSDTTQGSSTSNKQTSNGQTNQPNSQPAQPTAHHQPRWATEPTQTQPSSSAVWPGLWTPDRGY